MIGPGDLLGPAEHAALWLLQELVVRAVGQRPSFLVTLVRRIFTDDDRPRCD